MTTANDFMESVRYAHPDIWNAMQEAANDRITAAECPWLEDGATTKGKDGQAIMGQNNPVRMIKAEMDRAFDYRHEFKEASDCANRITNMLGRPLVKLLQELESDRGEGNEDREEERRRLERAVKDQLVDFAGHLWDIWPMESTDQFAERLVLARQAIEAATAEPATA